MFDAVDLYLQTRSDRECYDLSNGPDVERSQNQTSPATSRLASTTS